MSGPFLRDEVLFCFSSFFSLGHYFTRPYSLLTVLLVLIYGISFRLVFYATGSVWVAAFTHTLSNLWGDLPLTCILKSLQGQATYISSCWGSFQSFFFKKTRELFSTSGWTMNLMGIGLAIIALSYEWGKARLTPQVSKATLILILVAFSVLALAISFTQKRKILGGSE
jgi:membrane protease YdiL (CAAX protease family)